MVVTFRKEGDIVARLISCQINNRTWSSVDSWVGGHRGPLSMSVGLLHVILFQTHLQPRKEDSHSRAVWLSVCLSTVRTSVEQVLVLFFSSAWFI